MAENAEKDRHYNPACAHHMCVVSDVGGWNISLDAVFLVGVRKDV